MFKEFEQIPEETLANQAIENKTMIQKQNDEAKLGELLDDFDMAFLLPLLKAADITYRCLPYLSVEDINTAIHSVGYRAEFREKLFAWRRKEHSMISSNDNNRLETSRKRSSSSSKTPDSESDIDISSTRNPCKLSRSSKVQLRSISILSQLDIYDVINQSHYGPIIKDFYTKNDYLEPKHRDELIQIIVDFLLNNNIKLHCSDFEKITQEIVNIFPRERDTKDYYFIPRKPKGNPMGRLYTRYYNAVRKKRINQTVEDSASTSDGSSMDNKLEDNNVADSSLDEPSFNAIKSFLHCDNIDFEDVRAVWPKTYAARIEDMRRMSMKQFLHQWPKYLTPRGVELFNIDFNLKFPGKSAMLRDKWPEFKSKIYTYYNSHIKDEMCKGLYAVCRAKPGEVLEEYLLLTLLNSILPPTARFKDSVGTNRRKASIADAVEWFAICTPNLDQLQQRKLDLMQKYNYSSTQLLPDIVLVGENNLNIREIYVSFDKALYDVPDFLSAIDICMQIFRVLSIPYPQTIEYPWVFIQRYFYDITLPDDAKCPALISLFSFLKCK